MTKLLWLQAATLVAALSAPAADYTLHSFKKIQLSDKFWSEGATFGDFNRDGKMDIVSGPYWWEGPDFQKRHEYYPAKQTFTKKKADGTEETIAGFEGALGDKNAYSDNFFAFAQDFNADGWPDILIYGFPGKDASWFENPKGRDGAWERHVVFDMVDNESPMWTDLTGDGKPEIVCNSGGYFGYAAPDWKNPSAKWTFHPITPKGQWQRFTHGLGVGDVNGDGRMDILERGGWWEQSASLAGDPEWKLHREFFGTGGAQMYAYDVNGDGLNDVITSLAAHGFGLAWFEQYREAGAIKFRSHTIMNKEPNENRYGLKFAQLHAIDLVDMDGDGVKDIVTGKRFWAHGPKGDIEANADPVTYFFKITRRAGKPVDFVPHIIASDVGVGTQVVAGDVNGDKIPDVVIGNKKGTFVLLHETKPVSQAEWEKAQPKVLFPNAGLASVEPDKITAHTNPQRAAAAANANKKAAPPAAVAAASADAPNPNLPGNGVLPVGKDGKPLNTDFETGDLRDWTAKGDAFDKQPIAGDTVVKRRAPSRSNHAGKFWIGTYEIHADTAAGTLTSAPFKITHPWAAFLIAGGPYETTRVELVNTANQNVLFKISGGDAEKFQATNNSTETLAPVVVDLQAHLGKEIVIRVVDEQAGGHWSHINFDDFKFYAAKPQFANAVDAKRRPLAAKAGKAGPPPPPPAPLDEVKFDGLSAADAVKAMTLPPGFKGHVFAAEPDVKQPISFCIDDRGRLWVVEGYDYPQRKPEGEGTDRILVFEDTDGDHKFDKRTVFMEGLNFATGIEYGFGGVYVGAAPQLLFIPVKEGDEPKPAGKPQVLLEGWGYQDTHETLNSFQWGPDGWLYGCHGVFTHSNVKKPGDPDSTRQFINAGVWRYHPTKHIFEVFAEGTSNPWGIDFNEYGHCFIEACVIPHFWHIIQGARCQRQGGQHYATSIEEALRVVPDYFKQDFAAGKIEQPINPFIYDDIKAHGDHVHYLGDRPHGGNSRSAAAGGGHAHAGLMVYLGGSWPQQYHGKVLMGNIHGQCINLDVPECQGSGYVGKHAPDFLNFNDRWSQVINLRYDQDGSVYMIDWYDKQQCHLKEPWMHDRSNGRIYKIVHSSANDRATVGFDVAKLGDNDLAANQVSRNDWIARHTRRLLQERGASSKATIVLLKILNSSDSDVHKLRALWTLHSIGSLDEQLALGQLKSKEDPIRSWTIQFLCESKNPSDAALKEFTRMAKEDSSPVVRLYLASAMQRTPVAKRLPVLEALLAHAEDANDHNLPLMYWYAAEPVVGADTTQAVQLLAKCKIPIVREYITRRMTAAKPAAPTGK